MRRIVTVQPHLEYGGAERQTVILMNRLSELGVETHVVLHEARGGLLGELSSSVTVHDLGLENHLATPIVAKRLRKTLENIQPAFVIVKLWSSILASAMIDGKLPQHRFNYCEDLDPTDHAQYIRLGRLKQSVIGRIFRTNRILTANTNTVAESMAQVYGIPVPPVIPSVVDQEEVIRRSESDSNISPGAAFNIVTVGSLIERKGLRVLLSGLLDSDARIDWHLIGDGPLRAELERKSIELRESGAPLNLHLHGGRPNPYPEIRSADLLLHGAPSEAFGIVIVEALTLDTPVVAARAIGPTEIQKRLGQNTQLLTLFEAGSASDVARAVQGRIEDQALIASGSGRDYSKPYSLQGTVDLWLDRHDHYMQRKDAES